MGAMTDPDLSYIAEALRPLATALSDLKPDPANARKHGAKNLDAIRTSLKQFGQVKPIAVRKSDMVVIAGNGRLQVAKELGWTHLAAVLMEGTPEQLTAFAIADNKSAELASWDEIALSDLLRSVDTAGGVDLLGLGFQASELEALLDVEETDLPVPPTVETPDVTTPAAPKAPRAQDKAAPAAPDKSRAPAQRALDAGGRVGAEAWKAFQEAAAALREDREQPGLTDDECIAALARRYLRGRPS